MPVAPFVLGAVATLITYVPNAYTEADSRTTLFVFSK